MQADNATIDDTFDAKKCGLTWTLTDTDKCAKKSNGFLYSV